MLLDQTHAVMEQAEFDALDEYSCSEPTGVVIGKMWKRGEPYVGQRTNWFLGSYEANPADATTALVRYRRILIC
jgi:hypothetical protein